jgi:hypothetical protein
MKRASARLQRSGFDAEQGEKLKLYLLGIWASNEKKPKPLIIGAFTIRPSCPGYAVRLYHKLFGRWLESPSRNKKKYSYCGIPGCPSHERE